MAYTDKSTKIFSRRNYKNNKNNKIKYKLSLTTLIHLITYSISIDSDRNLRNLQKLLNMIDVKNTYNEEEEHLSLEYFKLLQLVVGFMIDYQFNDTEELFNFIIENTNEKEISKNTIETIFCDEENLFMNEKNIIYWNKFIENKLNYISLFNQLDSLQEIIDAFKIPDIDKDIDSIIPQVKDVINSLNKSLLSNTMTFDSKLNSFDILDTANAQAVIKDSMERNYNPGNKISTGIRALDDMFNGGFEGSRVYLLLGIPKHFKSGTMLNLTLNIASMCQDWKVNDESKIPAVVYFTMENSMAETFERMYNYLGLDFNFDYDIKVNKNGSETKLYKFSNEDIEEIREQILKETYEKTGIAFHIEFKSHRSESTDYLYTLYDDYLNKGQEIIFMCQDYIKRIRSTINYPDLRLELGEVVNEFGRFAKEKKIPVLTASQINREGIKSVEEAVSKNKKDISRKINGSMVGESTLIIENSDYVVIVDREFDNDSQLYYQTFKLVAGRGKNEDNVQYFAQPFDINPKYRGFKIKTDTDLKSSCAISRISSETDPNDVKVRDSSEEVMNNRINKKIKATISVKDIVNDDNIDNTEYSEDMKDFLE